HKLIVRRIAIGTLPPLLAPVQILMANETLGSTEPFQDVEPGLVEGRRASSVICSCPENPVIFRRGAWRTRNRRYRGGVWRWMSCAARPRYTIFVDTVTI